ncbi:hypothetical protein RchiOBHm_Chr5g0014311 [Rosa chinensis]|uniref:Uncharacterized protein n=1 Tax=Rosa chinensis TaxID=74649 RepID=A0A2P6Q5L9_ROSCH|nr:hypothetical protein RchiOBHm_Chr5g0014311 [Rosa chinensis]
MSPRPKTPKAPKPSNPKPAKVFSAYIKLAGSNGFLGQNDDVFSSATTFSSSIPLISGAGIWLS